MDLLGSLPSTVRGNRSVLVVGDYLTKWMEAYSIPNMESGTVAAVFVYDFVSRVRVCPIFSIKIRAVTLKLP